MELAYQANLQDLSAIYVHHSGLSAWHYLPVTEPEPCVPMLSVVDCQQMLITHLDKLNLLNTSETNHLMVSLLHCPGLQHYLCSGHVL